MSQASASSYPVQVALNLSPEGNLSPNVVGVENEALKAGHILDTQGERPLKAPPPSRSLGILHCLLYPAISESINVSDSHTTLRCYAHYLEIQLTLAAPKLWSG